jgi:hypothetical protein
MHPMRRFTPFVLIVISAGCATRSAIDAEKLQGNWTVVAVEKNGEPDLEEVGSTLGFHGTQAHFAPNRVPLVVVDAEPKREIPDAMG